MEIRKVKLKLEPDELPQGFAYPVTFLEFVEVFPRVEDQFDPWGLIAKPELNQSFSEQFGQQLLQFAQAWHEDMLACFVIDGSAEPRVVVINPWAQRVVDGKTEEFCMLLEQLPSFAAWLEWVHASDLVRLYAQHRTERDQATGEEDCPVERPH